MGCRWCFTFTSASVINPLHESWTWSPSSLLGFRPTYVALCLSTSPVVLGQSNRIGFTAVLRILMYNQFCAGLVTMSQVRAEGSRSLLFFIAFTAQRFLLVTQDKASWVVMCLSEWALQVFSCVFSTCFMERTSWNSWIALLYNLPYRNTEITLRTHRSWFTKIPNTDG